MKFKFIHKNLHHSGEVSCIFKSVPRAGHNTLGGWPRPAGCASPHYRKISTCTLCLTRPALNRMVKDTRL